MFKEFAWIFQNENQNRPLYLKKWLGSVREANTPSPVISQVFLGWIENGTSPLWIGPPPHAWPGCHTPAQRQVGPTGAYGSLHIASSRDGLGMLVTWALFSSGVTAAVGSPENDKLSLLFLPVGKKSEGNRREMFSYTQQLWLDFCTRSHYSLAFPTVSSCGRRETLTFLFKIASQL